MTDVKLFVSVVQKEDGLVAPFYFYLEDIFVLEGYCFQRDVWHSRFAEVLGDEVCCVKVHLILVGEMILFGSFYRPGVGDAYEERAAFRVEECCYCFEGC